jgi:hypothetical protein
MTTNNELTDALVLAIEKRGENAVREALLRLTEDETKYTRTLTILGNSGIHPIPETIIHGELYTATRGTLDLSKCGSLEELYASILRPLADKLREKAWQRIYFIPTGPTTLVLQIKLLVYHITRISTIDLFYLRGNYTEIDLDYRSYLGESE